MSNVAYIFPGQGAQYVGMGRDIYQRYAPAKETFDRACDILGFDITGLIFQGPAEQLARTVNCQMAVFTVSIACLRALETRHPLITVTYTAGLSLGEYSALVGSGAISFEEGLKLVQARARYMEWASQQNPGGMISIIGLPLDVIESICEQTKVEVANLNCPGQVVVSGSFPGLEKAKEMAQASGAKKVISLNVSGAFHSSLMAPAGQRLTEALEQVEFHQSKIPVVSNVTAKVAGSAEEIRSNLSRQVVSQTRWEDTIRFIASYGVKVFLEIGPGKVLKGLLRKIDPDLEVHSIGTVEEIEGFREE